MIPRTFSFLAVAVILFLSGTQFSEAIPNNRTKNRVADADQSYDAPREVLKMQLPSDMTKEQVQNVIVRAAMGREWRVIQKGPQQVTINLVHRRYDATLIFNYTADQIQVISDSWRVSRDGEHIKRQDPEGWIANLEKDINAYISRGHY